MTASLNQNHFELFGLPARFAVDTAALEARYHELQREVHPDRFAAAPDAERRVSMQLATRVNEAYQALKSPLKRAVYILQLRGVDPGFETNTAMPPEFLMEQMSWRERIEAGSENPEALLQLQAGLRAESGKIYETLHVQLDEGRDDAGASQTARMLMFYEKLAEEIDDKLAELET
ncbi:MAG TPA: Fe-S protein assembly co-chaperone HscB [Burkholderiales bacterium]|nr:Fe-S protein assembly co-chaperone HscB [Burkholderiales bacterium]